MFNYNIYTKTYIFSLMTQKNTTLLPRVFSMLTMALVGLFLCSSLLNIRGLAQKKEEEVEQTELVRTGAQTQPTNIVAVSLLFVTLMGIGIHAYTTQIYPSK